MIEVVSWNIATMHQTWRELLEMDADKALLQEVDTAPEDVLGRSEDNTYTSDILEVLEFSSLCLSLFTGSPSTRAIPKPETVQHKPAANDRNAYGGSDGEWPRN